MPRLSASAVHEVQSIRWDEFQVALTYEEAEQRVIEVVEFFLFLSEEQEEIPVPPPAHPSVSPQEQGQLF